MGMYKYMRDLWKRPKSNPLYKEHLIEWRKEPVSVRIFKPTRLDRARSLGYKAKPGYVIVRQKVVRGRRKRPDRAGGRRSKHARILQIIDKNHQQIAEERANRAYKNLEVLGSYYLAEDGQTKWYEVILVDPCHPAIEKDPRINWICNADQKGRAFRGKTSAGRKARGLRHKGIGAEKFRPSKKANRKRRSKI